MAAPGGPVTEVSGYHIEVHLNFGGEQVMGVVVHLLLRQSVGITSDTVPDEITFCEFRGFLVARDLTR